MKPVIKKEKSPAPASDESPPQRPKRNTCQKNIGMSNGLLWREETDLKRALYASLQETRKKNWEEEEGDETLEEENAEAPPNGNNEEDGPKKQKVHAQRKFAQGSTPNSPVPTPQKVPPINNLTTELLPCKRPKTEDFLTFLCLRGTSILPPSLDFLNTCSKNDSSSESRSSSPDLEVSDPIVVKEAVAVKSAEFRERSNITRSEIIENGVRKSACKTSSRRLFEAVMNKKNSGHSKVLKEQINVVKKRKSRDISERDEDDEFVPYTGSRSKTLCKTRSSTLHALREKYKKQRIASHKRKLLPSKNISSSKNSKQKKTIPPHPQTVQNRKSSGIVTRNQMKNVQVVADRVTKSKADKKLAIEKRKALRSANPHKKISLLSKKTPWLRRAKLVPPIVDVDSDSEPEIVNISQPKTSIANVARPPSKPKAYFSERLRKKQLLARNSTKLASKRILQRHVQNRKNLKKPIPSVKSTVNKKARKTLMLKTMSLRKDLQNKRITRSAKHQIEEMLWKDPEKRGRLHNTRTFMSHRKCNSCAEHALQKRKPLIHKGKELPKSKVNAKTTTSKNTPKSDRISKPKEEKPNRASFSKELPSTKAKDKPSHSKSEKTLKTDDSKNPSMETRNKHKTNTDIAVIDLTLNISNSLSDENEFETIRQSKKDTVKHERVKTNSDTQKNKLESNSKEKQIKAECSDQKTKTTPEAENQPKLALETSKVDNIQPRKSEDEESEHKPLAQHDLQVVVKQENPIPHEKIKPEPAVENIVQNNLNLTRPEKRSDKDISQLMLENDNTSNIKDDAGASCHNNISVPEKCSSDKHKPSHKENTAKNKSLIHDKKHKKSNIKDSSKLHKSTKLHKKNPTKSSSKSARKENKLKNEHKDKTESFLSLFDSDDTDDVLSDKDYENFTLDKIRRIEREKLAQKTSNMSSDADDEFIGHLGKAEKKDSETQKAKEEGESSKHKKEGKVKKKEDKSVKKDSLAKQLKKEKSKSSKKEEKKHKKDSSSSKSLKDGSKAHKKEHKDSSMDEDLDLGSEFKKDKPSKKESKLSRSSSHDEGKSPKKKTIVDQEFEKIKNLISKSSIINEIPGFKEFKRRNSSDKSEKRKKRKKLSLLKEKKLSKKLSSKLLRKYSKKKGLKKKLKKKELKDEKLHSKKKHKTKGEHHTKEKHSEATISESSSTENSNPLVEYLKLAAKPHAALPNEVTPTSHADAFTTASTSSQSYIIENIPEGVAAMEAMASDVSQTLPSEIVFNSAQELHGLMSTEFAGVFDETFSNNPILFAARDQMSQVPIHFLQEVTVTKVTADAATNTEDEELAEGTSPVVNEPLKSEEMSVGTQTMTPVGSPLVVVENPNVPSPKPTNVPVPERAKIPEPAEASTSTQPVITETPAKSTETPTKSTKEPTDSPAKHSPKPTGAQASPAKIKKRSQSLVKALKSNNSSEAVRKPFPSDKAKMVDAPVYQPTLEEFRDPLEYICKIQPEASKYGICKIIPPDSFKPECKVNDDMRFTAHNQYVHKMLYRWGPNIQHVACIKKHLKSQKIKFEQPPLIGGIELDISKFYHAVQQFGGLQKVIEKKKWQRVADVMRVPKTTQDRVTRLYDAYCKYLVSYDTLPREEKKKLEEEVIADHQRRVKLRQSSRSSEKDEEDFDDEENYDCVTKGRTMSLSNFFRIARNTMSMWYKTDPAPEEVEHEFWKLVKERQNHVVVHAGNIDSSVYQSGFPCNRNSPFAKHPWNLKILTNNSNSILRCMGPVSGVTIPTLHVGMLFTTGCWYRDPHSLPWIEYHHTGASKIWYGIPPDGCEKFRQAVKKIMPECYMNNPIWLASDTAMIPPELLVKHGASLSRTIQSSGQFIVIFPESFTSTICCGYCVSESVYFAPTSWLDLTQKAFQDIMDSCEPPSFSLERLLFCIANDPKTQLETFEKILPLIENIRSQEMTLRLELSELGLKELERLPLHETKDKKKKRGMEDESEQECEICRTHCYVSMVINPAEETIYCLPHAKEHIPKKDLKCCKLTFVYDEDDLNEIVKKIIESMAKLSAKKKSPKKKSMPEK